MVLHQQNNNSPLLTTSLQSLQHMFIWPPIKRYATLLHSYRYMSSQGILLRNFNPIESSKKLLMKL